MSYITGSVPFTPRIFRNQIALVIGLYKLLTCSDRAQSVIGGHAKYAISSGERFLIDEVHVEHVWL